jgi:DNA-binding MarR family transcriptional regulator
MGQLTKGLAHDRVGTQGVTGLDWRQASMSTAGTKSAKLFFAPLPPRAIGDQELTGLHLRVLACIALHDRMSGTRKTGQGCWAGNQTLARECGCNYNNLFTAIAHLAKHGYITRDPHPINKRLRVYRVIYNDDDLTLLKCADCSPTGEALPRQSGRTVRPNFENAERDQSLQTVEYIPLKREDIPLKGEINSSEDAPPSGGARLPDGNGNKLGAKLAAFERVLRSGEEIPNLEAWADLLEKINEGGELNDPNAQRAGRLLDDVWFELERRQRAAS